MRYATSSARQAYKRNQILGITSSVRPSVRPSVRDDNFGYNFDIV